MLDPPSGPSVPLVVQVGKWRTTFAASVNPCVENVVATKLHLARSASDGPAASLPDIAVSTGGADSLECLLTRVGVDPMEYVSGTSDAGHVHIFQGGVGGTGLAGPQTSGGSPASAQALWNTAESLRNYDVVLLSCEGAETQASNSSALEQYLRQYGGRVLASHFHYLWFTAAGSPLQNYTTGLQFQTGARDTNSIDAVVDTSFFEGQMLHDWLALPPVMAFTNDKLPIRRSYQNVLSYNNPPIESWIQADSTVAAPGVPGLTEYLSLRVVMGDLTCGRIDYTDLHVGSAAGDYGNALGTVGSTTNGVVPDQCNANAKLSPEEAVLEYMLFSLSSCPVTPLPRPPLTPAR
jgi:hypothetical protein